MTGMPSSIVLRPSDFTAIQDITSAWSARAKAYAVRYPDYLLHGRSPNFMLPRALRRNGGASACRPAHVSVRRRARRALRG
jgi:hypothetical protein